jgi:hypothetical protein
MQIERKYRMYGFVPYNISPIQQGIQYGHGVVEYGITYGETEEYQRWSRIDKTFIILNGGTTNTNIEHPGTINLITGNLKKLKVEFATFHEPDLGDQLTAVVFLVDERIWDREKYPDYRGSYVSTGWNTSPMEPEYSSWMSQFSDDVEEARRIIELRTWLKEFRLA